MGKRTRGHDREVAYFCPECQSIEVVVQIPRIIDPKNKDGAKTAECKFCGWKGKAAELIGAITPKNQQFWNAEKIGNLLIGVTLKHAAGPILQAMAFVGLLPKIQGSLEERESAQQLREEVTKEVLASAVTTAYETAARLVPAHYARFDVEQGAAVEATFSYKPEAANDPS